MEIQKSAINVLEEEIMKKKVELAKLRAENPLQEVQDYTFKTLDGQDIKLSDLFGTNDELIVIQNMGPSCAWCTMWLTGINGYKKYLESRASVVAISNSDPQIQKEFNEKQGWTLKTVTSENTTFKKDTGFESPEGGMLPGVSTFVRKDGKLYGANNAKFGPHDNFNVVYDFFDLLPGGWKEWDATMPSKLVAQ